MTQLQTDASGQVQGNPSDSGLDGQSQAAQANVWDPETHVLIEKEKLANVGGDINMAIHDAKEYQDLQSSGMGLLGDELTRRELTPIQLLNYLQSGEGEADPPPAQDPAAQQQAPEQGQPFDQTAFMAQVGNMVDQKFTTFNQTQQSSRAAADETKWMNDAMGEMGFGGDDKADARSLDIKPRIEARILAKRRNEAIAGDPDRDAKINRAFTQADIKAAANELAPLLAGELAARNEQQSNEQDGYPQANLGDGAGGRPQKDPKDMSQAEKKAQAIANVTGRLGRAPL